MSEFAPHSQDAEEALLGSILIDPYQFSGIADFLINADFFILRNGWIWEAMERLQERDEVIDYLTVIEELRTQGRLEDVGGAAYITNLVSNTATSIHAETYGLIVSRAALRRRMLDAANELTRLALAEDQDVMVSYAEAQKVVVDVVPDRLIQHNERTKDEYIDETLERTFNPPGGLIEFEPSDLHDLFGCFCPGEYIVIGARKGVGKTRFMLQQALANAEAGRPVLFLTIESPVHEIHWKLCEFMSQEKLTEHQLRQNYLSLSEVQQREFVSLMQKIRDIPLDIELVAGWTAEKVRRRVLRNRPGSYTMIVLDYLQALAESPGYERKHDELGHRSAILSDLAFEAQTVVLTAAQFNRDNAGKNQGTENIAGSDQIADRPQLVIALDRAPEDPLTSNIAGFIVKKDRSRGITGRRQNVLFHPERGTFGNLSTKEVNLNDE